MKEYPKHRNITIRQVDNGFIVEAHGKHYTELVFNTYSEASKKVGKMFAEKTIKKCYDSYNSCDSCEEKVPCMPCEY